MHENQLSVTVDMVGDLLRSQFPEWAGLPITPVRSEGTVNHIFRIGDRLAARFPLEGVEPDEVGAWLRSEAAAALELAAHTRFGVPEPVAIGRPGEGYPLPWSIQTWLPGTTASLEDVSSSVSFVQDLARFITEVRRIDVAGRVFSGGGRGGALPDHDEWLATCFERCEGMVDVRQLRRIWNRLRDLPREGPDLMTHGDLIPGNVVVSNGRLAGVLDVGGLGPADPALDLVAAWHLLDPDRRSVLRRDLGSGDLEWERGKAWALQQAMGAVWYYAETNPWMSRMGRTTLNRIIADEP